MSLERLAHSLEVSCQAVTNLRGCGKGPVVFQTALQSMGALIKSPYVSYQDLLSRRTLGQILEGRLG